jgi:hypothetical protein
MRERYLPQYISHAISFDFRPLSVAPLRDLHTIERQAPESTGRLIPADGQLGGVPAERSEGMALSFDAHQLSPHLVAQEVDHASAD